MSTVPDSQPDSTDDNPSAAASRKRVQQADQTSALGYRSLQPPDGNGDVGRPQSNGRIDLAVIEPLDVQLQGNSDAGEVPAEHIQPGAALWSSNTSEPQSNVRLRTSLEELEEAMPGAADMDEETREDKFLECGRIGAVRWCGASSTPHCA